MTSNQVSRVSRKVPRGLPNSVAILARTLVSPMPDRAVQVGRLEHVGPDPLGHRLRVVGLHPDEGLVPAEHLDDRAGHRAQGVHDDGGCRVVRRLSTGSTTASGQRRTAVRNGIPERTPKARAS